MNKIIFILLVTLSASAWAVESIPLAPDKKAVYDKVVGESTCQCGCGATIAACPHEYCSFAIPFRQDLIELLNQDKSIKEIFAYFVDKHGEVILAAPTFKGFNLMAWITPFVLILVVGYLVITLIGEWSKRSGGAGDGTAEGPSHAQLDKNDPHLRKLREELTKFED